MKNIHQQKILILDFGSQYAQLIARSVRESGVYSELHHHDMSAQAIKAFNPNGIILSGGPESVTVTDTPRVADIVFDLNVPVLGICYGMQAMAVHFSGQVQTSQQREFGHAKIALTKPSSLFAKLEKNLNVWMSHGDKVSQLPENFDVIAQSGNAPIAAMQHQSKPLYAVQFHPEVTHSECGVQLIENFVHTISHCQSSWTTRNIIDEAIDTIKKQVGKEHVILGLSGGVDSSVVAALLHQAIGEQLTCVFVDTGLLRLDEASQVMKIFADNMQVKVIKVDAEQQFMCALKGESCPEKKRKIIGKEFIKVFEQHATNIKNIKWLAQGTIYPDVIESAGTQSGTAKVIKSHHNVGGLPDDMALQLLEPLRELFKDEVRTMGVELGLPKAMLYRHPFPGPGLGIRILGEVKKEYADILRQADAIFMDELYKAELYYKVNQAFAVFLPIKSVGVVGDARQYEYVIALRAVETIDFMTARWAHLPYDFLSHVSNRIVNEVHHVSRVVYDISSKPP
ncbi:MAG: glutamine-hydrolyzing GMP synthase, partial [Gammaproteobacteria bacterium]|nr:glutamine-hydrolyzing GMP synthase [Gammaproteobacteria bacterium]